MLLKYVINLNNKLTNIENAFKIFVKYVNLNIYDVF